VQGVQVQGDLQAEAAVPGGADPDPGAYLGVAGVELAAYSFLRHTGLSVS
jgi:hypothetical protein